jgi:hypothetical protein
MGEGHRSCSHCGHELRTGGRFCGKCGRAVPADASEAAVPGNARPLTAAPVTPHAPPRNGPAASGRPAGRRRLPASAWPLVAVLAVLVAGGATALFLTRHSQGQRAVDSIGVALASSPEATASTSSAPPAPTAEQAAQSLSTLLAQSATDRGSIVNAVSDVNQCGPSLGRDSQVFQSAAASRQGLLSQLASFPGLSALSAQMLQDLTSAWQASAEADQDFAQWAQDEAAQGCTLGDQSDPGYQAAAVPDNEATADKEAFVSLWNPVAVNYGLPTYQWDQL